MTIFPSGEQQFMVNDPFWISVEKGGGWVDINRRSFDQRFVSLLGILFRRVPKESGAYRTPNPVIVFA